VPKPESVPSVVSTRTSEYTRWLAAWIDAAAETATSSDAAVCTRARVSRRIVERVCHGISSWRIIRSSRRAVDAQCTRRRSSPTSYGRSA
jgi:hypothetical protein